MKHFTTEEELTMHVTAVPIRAESRDGQRSGTRETRRDWSASANFLYEERLGGVSSERCPLQSDLLWPKHVAEICYNQREVFWSPW